MNNKKDGTAFEHRFAKALSKNSWVHLIKDNKNGQPFDVMAVSHNIAWAFDCKLCKGEVFKYSRIEVNQHLAFKHMALMGNENCFIAVCFGSEPDKAYCINYNKIKKDISHKEAIANADFTVKLCND